MQQNDLSIAFERLSRRSVLTDTGCLEFLGARLPNGYGKTRVAGKDWLAHRLAWASKNGAIPVDLCVCHTCDNRCCINPDHLFLGTRTDNMQDMIRKGRARFVGFQSPRFRYPSPKCGEKNGRAKLTKEKADLIRHAEDSRMIDTAKRFGVSYSTVQRIKAGKSWVTC